MYMSEAFDKLVLSRSHYNMERPNRALDATADDIRILCNFIYHDNYFADKF